MEGILWAGQARVRFVMMAVGLDKVTKFEEFLNEKLRSDLKRVLNSRDSVYSDIAEYLQLRNVIEKLRQGDQFQRKNVKAMVDIGANFYVQALIPDASRVCVAVGLGFFVEFTLSEALGFIDKKVTQLTEKGKELSWQASEIDARIHLVMEGLRELQFSSVSQRESSRIIW